MNGTLSGPPATREPWFRDFLLFQDLPVRLPLPEWAAAVSDRLGRGVPASRDDRVRTIATCLNLAALIEAHRGRADAAERTCLDQLAWLASEADGGADARLTSEVALQPWINLGRLARLRGDHGSARAHFDLPGTYRSGADACLGPFVVRASDWARIRRENPAMERFLENVQVVELLKTDFAAGDFDAAAQRVAGFRGSTSRELAPYLDEAEVLALAASGAWADASRLARLASRGLPVGQQFVFALRAAVLRGLAGERRGVADELRKVAAVAEWTGWRDRPSRTALRFVQALASALLRFDAPADAALLRRRCHAAATRLRDEPDRFACASALAESTAGEERDRWRRERRRLARTSWYAAIRRRAGTFERAVGDDAVFRRLGDDVAAAMATPEPSGAAG